MQLIYRFPDMISDHLPLDNYLQRHDVELRAKEFISTYHVSKKRKVRNARLFNEDWKSQVWTQRSICSNNGLSRINYYDLLWEVNHLSDPQAHMAASWTNHLTKEFLFEGQS